MNSNPKHEPVSKIKAGDIVVRNDGQVGVADSEVSKTTGRLWVKFDMEKPAHYVEASRVKLYEEQPK